MIVSLFMLLLRALLVWLLLAGVEISHGTVRSLFLVPAVGDWRSRQIGAFTGSFLILLIASLTVRWLGAQTRKALLGIGLLWLVLMLTFEVAAGRLLARYSWQRILSDYDLSQGGLLGLGMLVLTFSPLIAARLRGVPPFARPRRTA